MKQQNFPNIWRTSNPQNRNTQKQATCKSLKKLEFQKKTSRNSRANNKVGKTGLMG